MAQFPLPYQLSGSNQYRKREIGRHGKGSSSHTGRLYRVFVDLLRFLCSRRAIDQCSAETLSSERFHPCDHGSLGNLHDLDGFVPQLLRFDGRQVFPGLDRSRSVSRHQLLFIVLVQARRIGHSSGDFLFRSRPVRIFRWSLSSSHRSDGRNWRQGGMVMDLHPGGSGHNSRRDCLALVGVRFSGHSSFSLRHRS